jgi:hypothetical protein
MRFEPDLRIKKRVAGTELRELTVPSQRVEQRSCGLQVDGSDMDGRPLHQELAAVQVQLRAAEPHDHPRSVGLLHDRSSRISQEVSTLRVRLFRPWCQGSRLSEIGVESQAF